MCRYRAFLQHVVSLLKQKTGKSILSEKALLWCVPHGKTWAICPLLLKMERNASSKNNGRL